MREAKVAPATPFIEIGKCKQKIRDCGSIIHSDKYIHSRPRPMDGAFFVVLAAGIGTNRPNFLIPKDEKPALISLAYQ